MNIHDVLSPTALALTKTIGYGLLGVAWVVIVLAGYRLYCESTTQRNRW